MTAPRDPQTGTTPVCAACPCAWCDRPGCTHPVRDTWLARAAVRAGMRGLIPVGVAEWLRRWPGWR